SARAEVDYRRAGRADTLDQGARVGLDEAYIVGRTQRAYPTIENLDGTRTRANLQTGEIAEHIDELAHEAPPHRFVGEHQFFGFEERAGGAAFNHVTGERKRS